MGRGLGPCGPWLVVPQSRGLGAPASLGPRQEAGPQTAGHLLVSSPGPPLFTPLVTCSVAARVSCAWCRGSVGSGLQTRGPQLMPQALHPWPAHRLEAWPAGCPQLQSWAASGEPPSAKETGPCGVSEVKPAPEGPAQGHRAHWRQGARVLGSRRWVCRLAGPGGLSVPVLEVWLTLLLSFSGTLKLPALLPELSFLQRGEVLIQFSGRVIHKYA